MTRRRLPDRAGMVRRWHANADLCHIVDTVAEHGIRVRDLILKFWPESSPALQRWAEVHDFGEYATGDIPYPTKQAMPPEFRAWLECAEADALFEAVGELPTLSNVEVKRLKFADRLDAYQTAAKHAPHILADNAWIKARLSLEFQAITLGVKEFKA